MKSPKAIRRGPAVLGLMFFSPTVANPHTVRSRPACGVIELLDLASRTMHIWPKDDKATTKLTLTSRTKFVHSRHFAPADELKDGTRAVVYRRTPFFRKPFVTKVIWVNRN